MNPYDIFDSVPGATEVRPLDYQRNAVDAAARVCPHCGGRTVRGNLLNRAGIRLVPEYLRHLWRLDAGAIVTAFACVDCGAVMLAIEPQEQPKLTTLVTPGTFWRTCGRVAGRAWRWTGGR